MEMDNSTDDMDGGGEPVGAGAGDSDSGDDSGSETELQEQIAALKQTLTDSPFHYNSHVELIQFLRQLGDLDQARQARQQMSEIFPLTEGLWLEWVRDELPLSSLPKACTELRELFERAVQDYLSVPVWLEYAKFAVDKMSLMPEGMEFPRDVFERAIVACGLHVSQAGLLWNTYREFEMAVLSSLQQMQQADLEDVGLKSQVEEQYERVDKLYKRQLGVPLSGMESTFQDYKSFSETVITEESVPTYIRARQKLDTFQPFEDKLASSIPPTLESYYVYISHIKSSKEDPTFINCLYQRAVAHYPIDIELWKTYLSFLTQTFSRVPSILLPAHKQAVRNCPWMVEFWCSYVRSQERVATDHEEIIATFEKGLSGNFTVAKDYLQLWTVFCDYLRRRVNEEEGEEEMQRRVVDLRRTFKRARDELETYYGQDGDPTDSLSRFQASVEARCYGNIEEARFLFSDVMSRHGREAGYWLEYAEIERNCGDLANCRKVLQRSVNSASDDPERVCQALLRFEREVGSLETFEAALERCAAQLKRVQQRQEKISEKEAQLKEEKKKRKKAEKVQRKTATGAAKAGGDVKQTTTPGTREGSGGRSGGIKRRRPQATHVFFDDDEDEEEESKIPAKRQRQAAEPSRVGLQPQPQGRPQVETSETAGTKKVEDREEEEGGKTGTDESMEVATSSEKQEKYLVKPPPGYKGRPTSAMEEKDHNGRDGGSAGNKVFVSNLAHSVTQQQLQEIFAECGTVSEIRLIKTKGRAGNLNVYAYVDYSSNKDTVQKALALDRTELLGRPMFVTVCREKGDQPTAFKYAETNNLATVFVSNIQHSITEGDLEELFKQCGEIKEVRLVKNRAGRSKGFAYIEFREEPSANIAVLKLDNHQLGFKRIKVAISNPPKKPAHAQGRVAGQAGPPGEKGGGASLEQFVKPTFVPPRALGPGKKTADLTNPLARKSKTHVSLLPRVVARKEAGGGGGEKSEEQRPKLSNEDFRKMLS